jgi:acyl transferase domain-containing protein
MRDPEELPRYVMTGNGATMMANRISHFYDLRGPSMTVDTGCSTGLVALHQACQSLKTSDAKTAIVVGANIMINPDIFVLWSSLGYANAPPHYAQYHVLIFYQFLEPGWQVLLL